MLALGFTDIMYILCTRIVKIKSGLATWQAKEGFNLLSKSLETAAAVVK